MTEEILYVSDMLKESLPDEPEALIRSLENIEVWNARMQFLLAEKNSILAHQSLVNLPTEGTETTKKIALKALTAEEEEDRAKIEALVDAIKTRITLGQSILKYFSTTQNIQYKQQNNTKGEPW